MNTFDVFDTLIARRFFDTKSVWRQMSKEFDIENFENIRPEPDDGSRSFQGIYDELERQNKIPAHLKMCLMEREIELEIDNCYGIRENLDKVEDGDLLISDMYLPPQVILQMVRSAGLNKQITIHQSNRDKGTGKIWGILQSAPPNFHLGDNQHTDVIRPKSFGINTQHYTGSNYTINERWLIDNKLYFIGHLVREVRLSNNIQDCKEYFEISNQFNLPLLFVIAEQLHRSIKTPITFLGRDCFLLHKLFNRFYRTAYYLPFSRKVALLQPEMAALYLNKMKTEDTVLVDISSTGETWIHMNQFGKFNVKTVIYGDSKTRSNLPESFSYLTKNSICGDTNLMLEIMNSADHGMLTRLELIGDDITKSYYGERELPDDILIAIHTVINDAVNLSDYYKTNIRQELAQLTDIELSSLFKILANRICSNIHLSNNIPNFHQIEDQYHQEILRLRKK